MTSDASVPARSIHEPTLQRAISLRTLLLMGAGVIALFVATVGIALAYRVVPSANELAARTTRTQADFLERTRAAAALDSAITDLWRQLRMARTTSLDADSLAQRRERIEALVLGAATLAPFQRTTRLTPELGAQLERADYAVMGVAGTLLGVVGQLEIRALDDAERLLLRADSLDSPLTEQLTEVTATALGELTRDEERLINQARAATSLVVGWLAAGLVLLPLIWWFLRQRLFTPLIALDRSLTKIEEGELDVEIVAPRDDELGRLHAHFNRATKVLRQQRADAERAATSAALAVSEAHYRSAFDHAAVGLAELSLDQRYQRINRAMTRILGRPQEDIIGRSFLTFTHPADVETDLNVWTRITSPGAGLVPRDKRYIRPDGSVASVQITATLIREPDGTPRHVLSVIHDVTEQRRLERHMLQTSKMDAVGQLAGGVAHDFNNLLTGIIGFADLLEHDAGKSSDVREDAASIRSIALRGAALARSLLALARRNPHREEPFSLESMMRETVELIQRTFDRRIEVRLQIEATATIKGDRSLLSNALLNLALNARDAMPEGGILTLSARCESLDAAACLQRGITQPGDYAVIEVVDTGAGMPPEIQERIFEPFFTTKLMGEGTGLGLAMVYGTVQSHGGVIQVDSVVGQGTRFTVYLPRAGDETAEVQTATTPLVAESAARVLVVDDEEMVRTVAERMLRRLGYEVESVGDGIAALERLADSSHGIDVVLLDGNMPRLNGLETAVRIHQQYPDLALIYGSGHFELDASVDFDAIGFRERLTKPYTMEELSRAVARCLSTPPAT